MRNTFAALLLAGVAVAALSPDAFAQKRHRVRAAEPVVASVDSASSPLTVNRRSWLDPGNATRTTGNYGAPYVQENTIVSSTAFNETQDQIFAPGKFGNSVIVGPPDVPGRSQPVAQGSSLPNGQVVVDNALFPQNFYFNPAPALSY